MFDYLKKSIEDSKRRIAVLEEMAATARARQEQRRRLEDEAAWQRVVARIDAAMERFRL